MAAGTLLEVVNRRFGVHVDATSDGGQILNSLTTRPDFGDADITGEADGTLTLTPTPSGVRLRPPTAGDALLFQAPAGSFEFILVPPPAGGGAPQVEIVLVAPTVPLPFLRAARENADGMLEEAAGDVSLAFPNLLLVVSATENPPASARLAPSHGAAGELEISMNPVHALIGPGTVLGIGFTKGTLALDGPGEPSISVPNLDLYVAPEGIPPLAMRGGAHGLTIGLGVSNAGLSGELEVRLADGAQAPLRPDFLRALAARIDLQRNTVTLLELTGQIALGDAVTAHLGQPLSDGADLLNYLLRLTLDHGSWQAQLTLSASGGGGYLWRTQRTNPDQRDAVRDTLGAYAVFAPLLSGAVPDADDSGYANLAIAAGASTALSQSQFATTRSLTLFGGTLIVREPAGQPPRSFLFFEVESEVDLNVEVAGNKLLATRKPIRVRQKSIGVELDFGTAAGTQLKPVFDPEQGFALDLSDPGTFEIPGPLGEILQPDAARVARENPVTFEIDVLTKADLGVVTIDRASVRVPLDEPATPTLTGLGAHLNAGPIQGGGYLRVLPDGLEGGFDAAFATPLGIRASADLKLAKAHDTQTNEDLTSVLIGFSVEWPVPIVIGNSGLGLFGFLGLFAMHQERKESNAGAVQWLLDAGGDPAKGAWQGAAHRWAIGLGAVIGTVEGGFLIHAKGMLLLELPGPRLLLMMKADILSARPPKEGTDTGTLLAVIDLRPESLTIGIVAQYKIPFLLEVQVPAEALFDFTKAENWHLDIGGIPESVPAKLPASVRFMSSLRADGYLLIHGDGIPDFPLRALHGFSVASGIRAALTWGPEEIGLYIRVAARADVGISFKPMLIIGRVTLEGELHLFIISIGASASAELTIVGTRYYVKATVCGEVNFFLFSVEGCVTFELGDESVTQDLPDPDPLIRGLSLHSRTPALVLGSGADRQIDGSLGTAFLGDNNGHFHGATPDAQLPVVPIDAIPVLQFEMRPHATNACSFVTQPIPSLLNATSWVRRGERFYRYTLKSVALTRVNDNGADLGSALDEGDTPAVWWDRHGKPAPGDDSDVQLALLNWIPDPTPTAAERTLNRDEQVKRRWGSVCDEVAPPASVLWTFTGEPLGPSSAGWLRHGIVSLDPPGTTRSNPPDDRLTVSEPWRSDWLADSLLHVTPAYILGADDRPERLLISPRTGEEPRPRIDDDERFQAILDAHAAERRDLLRDTLRFTSAGARRLRGLAFMQFEMGNFTLRTIDSDGNPTDEQSLGPLSRDIDPASDLPPEWVDPNGAWLVEIKKVITAWFRVFSGRVGEPRLFLFEVDVPDEAAQVELGLRGAGHESPFPDWGLLVLEGTASGEFARFEFDKEQRDTLIRVIDGALGADQAKRALMRPGSLYDVEVAYDVVAIGVDASGNPKPGEVPFNNKTQRFRFKTDTAPPERLDSWTLASAPAEGEASFFYADPVRIVFATNATRRLFAAYGTTLFAKVRAASGKHPPANAGFDPADVQIDLATVRPNTIAALAMTPFQGALREAVQGQDCVDSEGSTAAHEIVTLTLQLEPSTQYIVDLVAKHQDGSVVGDHAYPLLRRNFATSRYPDSRSFAAAMVAAAPTHRALADPTPLTQLGAAFSVTDLDFENALRAASWGDLARPTAPRTTVIWHTDAAGNEQPVALLIETTEAHWRTRRVPQLVADPAGTQRYQLVERPWLELIDSSTPAGLVSRLARTRDGSRTLAVLQPGARGNTVALSMRRTSHPLFEGSAGTASNECVRIKLDRAPWETA